MVTLGNELAPQAVSSTRCLEAVYIYPAPRTGIVTRFSYIGSMYAIPSSRDAGRHVEHWSQYLVAKFGWEPWQ